MSDPPTMPLATRFGIASKPASRELTSAGTSAHSRLYDRVVSGTHRRVGGNQSNACELLHLRQGRLAGADSDYVPHGLLNEAATRQSYPCYDFPRGVACYRQSRNDGVGQHSLSQHEIAAVQ